MEAAIAIIHSTNICARWGWREETGIILELLEGGSQVSSASPEASEMQVPGPHCPESVMTLESTV